MKDLYKKAKQFVRREPVRAFGYAAAVAVLVVSQVTGTPVAVLVGEIAGAVAAIERVRSMVTPAHTE